MDDELRKHYEVVLSDLVKQKNSLRQRVSEIDQTLSNISRLLESSAPSIPQAQTQNLKYRNFSVRWAILFLLSENEKQFTVQEIADLLKDGGIQTKATNFTNNVSAVLSQMKTKDDPEVEIIDGRWIITETGKSAWAHISKKNKKIFNPYF